jgi:lipopolysaccharide transport system permease protein
VYFPRLLLPLSTVVSSLLDFAVSLVVMVVLMLIYRVPLTAALLMLPVWMVLISALAIGIGLFAASLTVSYRDVQYLMPVVLQLLLYASAVGYAVPDEPHKVKMLLLLNPITGLIEAFRWSVLGMSPHWWAVGYASIIALIALIAGAIAFKRMEQKFADVI